MDKPTDYKLKKGTIRRQYFECGFEAGANCTITHIKNSLKQDQTINYTDIIKILHNMKIPSEHSLTEFEKIKHKYLSSENLKKRQIGRAHV